LDGSQFDTLLRGLTTAKSRRGAVLGLVGGAIGLLRLTESEAKHKKKHKKKKSRGSPPAPPPTSPPSPPPPTGCQRQCQGKSCGDDGCGGSCGPCVGATTQCCNGACVDLATDPANCGLCGQACPSGECYRGSCTCPNNDASLCPNASCICGQSKNDVPVGPYACRKPGEMTSGCTFGTDCPFGSFCKQNTSHCSVSCTL
jgi:hypothetical protein